MMTALSLARIYFHLPGSIFTCPNNIIYLFIIDLLSIHLLFFFNRSLGGVLVARGDRATVKFEPWVLIAI